MKCQVVQLGWWGGRTQSPKGISAVLQDKEMSSWSPGVMGSNGLKMGMNRLRQIDRRAAVVLSWRLVGLEFRSREVRRT